MLRRTISISTWIIITWLYTSYVSGNILATLNNGAQIQFTATEIIFKGKSNHRISDPIVLVPTLNETDLTNKVLFAKNAFSNDAHIVEAQSRGASAMVVVTLSNTVPGYMRYRFMDKNLIQQIAIPVFEMANIDYVHLEPYLLNNSIITITLLPSDQPNPWSVVLESAGQFIYEAILIAFSTTNIALASLKIKEFIKFYSGYKTSISLTVLFLEIISNLLRIAVNIDLFGVFNFYSELAIAAMYYMSFPFAFASITLFSLYWHELMTTSSIVVHPFIVKMKIPFFVLGGALLLLQLAVILVRSFTLTNFYLVATIIYMILNALVVIFYLATGIKLLKRMFQTNRKGQRIRYLKKTTLHVLISAGFLLVLEAVAVMFPFKGNTPIGFFMGLCTIYLILNCVSMVNVLAFKVPRGRTTSSRNLPTFPPTNNSNNNAVDSSGNTSSTNSTGPGTSGTVTTNATEETTNVDQVS